jgi:hypothetical protein
MIRTERKSVAPYTLTGQVLPLSGLVKALSRYANGPFANATMYVDILGVVSNRLMIQSFASCLTPYDSSSGSCAESYGPSKNAGILLRFTVPARDISDIANVAFSAGSSQHGNARRA